GRDAAAARGKRPGREGRRTRLLVRPRLVPGDALDFVRQPAARRFDDDEQIVRELVREAKAQENVRAGRRRAARPIDRQEAEAKDPRAGRPQLATEGGVPVGVVQGSWHGVWRVDE